jgi:signal-transduction protein with cAMP-binding, CBS, and nucleotidyltransferase domain
MEEICKEGNHSKNGLNKNEFLINFIETGDLFGHFSLPDDNQDLGLLMAFEGVCYDLLQKLFSDLFYPDTRYSQNETNQLFKIHRQHYEKKIDELKLLAQSDVALKI